MPETSGTTTKTKNPAIGVTQSHRVRIVASVLVLAIALSAPAHALMINVNYDPSVAAYAPSKFKSAFQDAVNFYESNFANPSTVNVNVGWGEADGTNLTPGALGESLTYLQKFSYASIRTALTNAGAPGSDYLPSSDPYGPVWLATADAKALGLDTANGGGLDGYVGFSAGAPFTFDATGSIAPGTYDFLAVAEHEISEVLGRFGLMGTTVDNQPGWAVQDLYRYTSPGVRAGNGSQSSYFSVDGGQTNLKPFNNVSGGDIGDWASGTNDAFNAFSYSGVVDSFSPTDFTMMQALGYQTIPEPGTLPIMLTGLGVLGWFQRRRRKASYVAQRVATLP